MCRTEALDQQRPSGGDPITVVSSAAFRGLELSSVSFFIIHHFGIRRVFADGAAANLAPSKHPALLCFLGRKGSLCSLSKEVVGGFAEISHCAHVHKGIHAWKNWPCAVCINKGRWWRLHLLSCIMPLHLARAVMHYGVSVINAINTSPAPLPYDCNQMENDLL